MHRFVALWPVAFLLALSAVITTPPTFADDDSKTKEVETKQEEKSEDSEKAEGSEPKLSVTTGTVAIAGKDIDYVATAGKLPQKDDSGDEKAEVFFVAYTKGTQGEDGNAVTDASRPITFCFNGGPGSSSVWLHLGMLGPKRVCLPDDASFPAPPYAVEDNPFSLLDETDLVFIDPVGTGYSRPTEGEKKEQFHGVEEDFESVGQFIHDYTTRFERWGSPKMILGESYGGLRAGGLARLLQNRYRMYLNGVVLVSAVLDFSTLHFAENNDLPYVLFLPSYTATAWYHKALDDELLAKPLEEVVAMTEAFAYDAYADALLQGAAMPEAERQAVAEEAARLTGLPVDYVLGANLRVKMWQFSKELLRDRNQIVGRFDSRYAGPGKDTIGESMDYDPSDHAYKGIFGAAMNAYLRDELDYEDDERVYEIIGSVRPWSYKPYENRYVTTAGFLADAMTMNPSLEVFAACGHYDLATPAFAMKHTRDHALQRSDLSRRVTMAYYEGGHMMYVHEPSLAKLRKDLLKWYEKATP